ncbi:MAG: hypothetical protein ACRC9O_07180, partial [Plesiomonas sp.]|uniref:hypothetical protein n=1 Tax=Plesiomonas sp. TaxID=2486279 RepID=UPI003F35EB95
ISSSGLASSSKSNSESLPRQDSNSVNGNLNTEANKATRNESVAGQVDWERLRLQGQLKTLPNENVLRGGHFQYGDNAAWELIHAVRGVLTPAPTLSVTQRTAYDRWLNQILPNKITAQANLPSGQDQLPRVSELLKHPDIAQSRPKLESFVKQMLRVTNLAAYSERPVIRALLDGLDVGKEKTVATPVTDRQVATAQGLHDAARSVASALTELIDIANSKPSAVATSVSRSDLVTPTVTEIASSGLILSSKPKTKLLQRQDTRNINAHLNVSANKVIENNELDVGKEKAVATLVADRKVVTAQNLHDAARSVASELTELIDIANLKPSAVATPASHVTPTVTESTLSHLASSNVQRSLIRNLENEVSMSRARPIDTNKGTR